MSINEKKSSGRNNNYDSKLEKASLLPLVKINFILMACSAAMIVIGFLLLLGSSSSTSEFNADIFSTRRIVVGPTIALLGFVCMGFSIIYRPKK